MTEYNSNMKLVDGSNIKYVYIEEHKIFLYDVEYLECISGLYGFIYVTTNLINGKMYVGQRKIKYKNKSNAWKTYLGSGTILKKALKKYGKESFDRKIIDIAFNQDELNKLEYFYTKVFDSVNKENWYNLHYGGEVGEKTHYNLSEEGKRNQLLHHPWKGKHHSEETKRKMSEAAKKREKRKRENRHKMSEETREKISEANKGKESKTRKKVSQYTMNGEFIKTWSYSIEASNELNIDLSTLRLAASGKYKSAGGFQWRYANNDNACENINPYKKSPRKDKGIKRSNRIPIKRMNKEEISKFHRENHSIKINQYTINDEYIKTYDSATQAHLLDGHHVGSIRQCCKYNMKTHHNYKWFNANDPNQPDKSKIIHNTKEV